MVADGDEYIHIKIHLAGEEWKENGSTSSVQLARNGSFIFYFTQSLCQCNSVGGMVWAGLRQTSGGGWWVSPCHQHQHPQRTHRLLVISEQSAAWWLHLGSVLHVYIPIRVSVAVCLLCTFQRLWHYLQLVADMGGGCELNRPPHFCNAGKSILELFLSVGFRFNHHCSRRGTKCSFFHKKCIL